MDEPGGEMDASDSRRCCGDANRRQSEGQGEEGEPGSLGSLRQRCPAFRSAQSKQSHLHISK